MKLENMTLDLKIDKKYILKVLILAILILLLYKIFSTKMTITNKFINETFNNQTYPSVSCKTVKLSSIDNNIILFGILFYDDSGNLVDPNLASFNISSTYGVYYPNNAAKGIYNNFIKPNKIVRNLTSLQNTIVNYNNSDNAININFTDASGHSVNLPTSFGTWNINPKFTWVSATDDSYSNSNISGNSYWTITFPTQINLSAIEFIGFTSTNATMNLIITDNNDKITFEQILPKTAPRDYYRQIIMPCQFYINIPDSNGNTTNNYVNYSSKGYLTSKSINTYSNPDIFFIMQDTGRTFTYSPNRQIIYSGDGQNKFIYNSNGFIKIQKQDNTTTNNDDHIQLRIGDFNNNPIDTSLLYLFGDYANYGYLRLFGNIFEGSSSGTNIKLIPINQYNQITTTTSATLAPSTTLASATATLAPSTTLASTATTPFTTKPYNTQYLSNIQNQINNGYPMLNNNRFTIIDNQLILDGLNSRVNKLLNNINKLNNFSNKDITQSNDLTFY